MARKAALALADLRATKIESRRENPMDGGGLFSKIMGRGGGAVPSTGLSQFRGGMRRRAPSASDDEDNALRAKITKRSEAERKKKRDTEARMEATERSGATPAQLAAMLRQRKKLGFPEQGPPPTDPELMSRVRREMESIDSAHAARTAALPSLYAARAAARAAAPAVPDVVSADSLTGMGHKLGRLLHSEHGPEAHREFVEAVHQGGGISKEDFAARTKRLGNERAKKDQRRARNESAKRSNDSLFGKIAKVGLQGAVGVAKLARPFADKVGIPGLGMVADYAIANAEKDGYGHPSGGFGASKTGAYEGHGKKKRRPAGPEDGRRKRAAIVKQVMAEHGMKMIDASKYVKEHGLY